MISLTTLLASATVAAAAKKVEDVPAPGVVDTWTLGTALGLKYVAARA